MSTQLKILLADDQIPWPTDAENDRTKGEICREFAIAKPKVNVEKAFPKGFKWFTGLLNYLEKTKGVFVVRARTFDQATDSLLNNPVELDVGIVDLSWWGDYTRPHGEGERLNLGLELLKEAAVAERRTVPLICLSQNFKDDFELISTVLDLGALPVPKDYKCPKLGYQMIYAAVQYLARNRRPTSDVQLFVSHAHADRELARELLHAIESGLQVPTGAIRCTSVPGYDFRPGAHFEEALKKDVQGAQCVIGIWTSGSRESQWCLFELGAAWGLAQRAFFLTLGDDDLRSPPAAFRSIQSSRLDDSVQLCAFLKEVEAITGWQRKDIAAAERKLKKLARVARGRVAVQ
jgi:TIR domain